VKKLIIVIGVLATMLITAACNGGGASPAGPSPTTETPAPAADKEIAFSDPNLEAAIREATGKLEGTIYASDLEELTMLFAIGMGITDLTGLEHCTNLTMLHLGNNQINDISPLSSLINLRELDLRGNEISDISPLASLTNLAVLELSFNRICDISSLSSLTNLGLLGLNGSPESNRINDISPLASLTNLRTVKLWNNQIEDVEPFPAQSPDGFYS